MLLLKCNPHPYISSCVDNILLQEDMNPVNFANRRPVKVLPSTLAVIGIQYGQRMKVIGAREETLLGSSGVTGLQASCKQYVSTGSIGTIIVTFKPGGLAAFISCPIQELQDSNVDLDHVFPKHAVDEMEQRLHEACTAAERVDVVQHFLLSQYAYTRRQGLILEAARQIQLQKGDISIERLAGELFVSKRTLERRFHTEIGIAPKKFANIVRFQRAIQLKKSGLPYLDIIEACRFSDHAHFAHDFKAFAGCSPEQFFRETLQPELAAQYNEDKTDSPVAHTMYQ